jgi:hypothetical protein
MVLGLDPGAAGLPRTERVWGATMDVGMERGTYTLVSLADGTTSLYLSTGGGFIGAGAHPAVAAATRQFLAAVEGALDGFGPDPDDALPALGRVIIRALGWDGRRRVEGVEDDLGNGRDPWSALFHAAHGVITQVRLTQQG